MDTALLTHSTFWNDDASPLPEFPELAGHVLFETSGSSGEPKWVAISKRALLASASAVNRHLSVTSESCWGLALPLTHVGGFGVAARAYDAGCRIETFDQRWDATRYREWLGMNQVTHASLVPTQVHDLVKAGLTAPRDLTAIVVGGGHLDRLTGQAARDLGWPVLASYGMTEAASQIATQGLEELMKPYQHSPIPLLPIWQARVTADGLLAISGPALFSGYFTGNRYHPRRDGWHVTSDRVALENGSLSPLGRADHRIKVLGELVDPEAIERELLSLYPKKLSPVDFAIIAVPDERAENLLVPAFVARIDPAVIRDVLAEYNQQAPGFRRLGEPFVVEELPRSLLGKLRRAELTEIYHHFRAMQKGRDVCR